MLLRAMLRLGVWLLSVAAWPATVMAQEVLALIQTVELDPAEKRQIVSFPDTPMRSLALRIGAKTGSVTLNKLTVTYGNAQIHVEDRVIALKGGERTREIDRKTRGLAIDTLAIDYTADPKAPKPVIEIWSLQVPPAPPRPEASMPRRAMDMSSPGQAKAPRYNTVLVHYATNRNRLDDRVKQDTKLAAFGGDIGDKLHWGDAVVTVPIERAPGSIPRPLTIFSFELRKEDPARDFTLASVEVTTADAVSASMARVVGEAKTFAGQALVFVHGYNVSFDDAVFRLAQLAHDMHFDGPITTYSWPSRGATLDYRHDLDAARVGKGHLGEVLARVAAVKGVTRVNLIAHSMGSDPAIEALALHSDMIAVGGKVPDLKLNEVIFAAPDVSRPLFVQQAVKLKSIAKGVTLYASSNDLALKASRVFAGGVTRAGDVPTEGPPVVVGVDSLDISAVSTASFALNHSTFADRDTLISDIRKLISGRAPPSERAPAYVETGKAPSAFWRYILGAR